MLIENATREVHTARRRHQRELAERNRYRRVIETVDEVIESCEETHLQSIKECPPDLKLWAKDVLVRAERVVARSGGPSAVEIVGTQVGRQTRKVTEVMDALWTVQEVVFDLMLPWRTELPEDVELPGLAVTWRFDSAA